MDILFIIDRIELKYFEFNNLVTNFWLIKEFLLRNNKVWITTIRTTSSGIFDNQFGNFGTDNFRNLN